MTIEQLIADIRITFPTMCVMEREHCMTGKKAWMLGADESAKMPDNLPIFSELCYAEDTYDDCVHMAFTAWLENRGFYLENHDGFWRYPQPIPTAEELAEWERQYQIERAAFLAANPAPVLPDDDDGLPF